VSTSSPERIRIAAISFLNPAPLMWDFEHPPLQPALEARYRLDWMLPSACADNLVSGQADLGLVPIATLPFHPWLHIFPGCVIASKARIRSLLLVRRASQKISTIETVAADTASRTTIAHTRILFRHWGNTNAAFLPAKADLNSMLTMADAAILIGDPALMALELNDPRHPITGEELVFQDLALEWRALTGLPFVSAVWCSSLHRNRVGNTAEIEATITEDLLRSRDHGIANVSALAKEWSLRLPLAPASIHSYLSESIHYNLDDECLEAMRTFFRLAAEAEILPAYSLPDLSL